MEQTPNTCPYCKNPIPLSDIKFCPYCGKKLAVGTSFGSRITVYLVSILLPPLGFWYTYKYLRLSDPEARKIGWIATVLTALSLIAAIWLGKATLDAVNQAAQSYTNLGF